jgi:SAM-dependent methyltransferase
MNEMDRLKKAYARRTVQGKNGLYDPLAPVTWMVEQEFERAFLKLIKKCGLEPVANLRVLDVGCGGGTTLLQLIRYGFDPANMTGIELLHDRYKAAARRLPKSVVLVEGDAMEADVGCGIFDVVIAFTVFSSILDDDFRKRLAKHLWSFCKPQGGVLWYDFIFNNPANPDVRAVPMREIRELFPDAKIRRWRVTLAPPVARVLTRLHPALYTLVNVIVPLRTHILCWIGKNGSP